MSLVKLRRTSDVSVGGGLSIATSRIATRLYGCGVVEWTTRSQLEDDAPTVAFVPSFQIPYWIVLNVIFLRTEGGQKKYLRRIFIPKYVISVFCGLRN